MTTIDLKKLLVRKIEEIDDKSFLNAIKTILDSRTRSQTLYLNDDQRNEIIGSRNEIEKGLYLDQSEMDKEFDKWLSAR